MVALISNSCYIRPFEVVALQNNNMKENHRTHTIIRFILYSSVLFIYSTYFQDEQVFVLAAVLIPLTPSVSPLMNVVTRPRWVASVTKGPRTPMMGAAETASSPATLEREAQAAEMRALFELAAETT